MRYPIAFASCLCTNCSLVVTTIRISASRTFWFLGTRPRKERPMNRQRRKSSIPIPIRTCRIATAGCGHSVMTSLANHIRSGHLHTIIVTPMAPGAVIAPYPTAALSMWPGPVPRGSRRPLRSHTESRRLAESLLLSLARLPRRMTAVVNERRHRMMASRFARSRKRC